jgi:hypothetical protein
MPELHRKCDAPTPRNMHAVSARREFSRSNEFWTHTHIRHRHPFDAQYRVGAGPGTKAHNMTSFNAIISAWSSYENNCCAR